MPRHIQLQGSWNNLAHQSISLLRITFTKDHKGLQTPLRITKPGSGGPRIHGSRLFTFLKKTPCAEFHRKMNESIWTSVYNHSIILTSNGSKHLVKIEYHSYYVGVNTKRIRSQLTCQECSLEGIMCIACPMTGKKFQPKNYFE